MKILHLTKKYPNALGGDAIVVANLEAQARKAGHDVVILTSNCAEIKKAPHVHTFGLLDTPAGLDNITPRRLLSLLHLFVKSFGFLRRERPDVIHTHSIDMAFCLSLAARLYKIPLVHTFHIVTFNNPEQAALRRKTELFFLRGANPKRVLVLNPGDIPDFEAQGFTNVQFVPNGVNLEDWNLPDTPKTERFTFLDVCRLEEQKGLPYLLEASAELKKRGHHFAVQVAGDGSQRELLERRIVELDLQDTVQLLGRKTPEELKVLYAQSHAFVLPSLWEAFPLTILEAWAARLAVIATAVGFCSQKRDSPEILIVEPKNAVELANAMEILIMNPARATELAQLGHQAAVENYTWERVSNTVTEIYQEARA